MSGWPVGGKGVVECALVPLVGREVVEQVQVGAGDQGGDGLGCGVGDAAEVGAGDEVEHGLFDGGDRALAEFGVVALDVEAGDVAADEVDARGPQSTSTQSRVRCTAFFHWAYPSARCSSDHRGVHRLLSFQFALSSSVSRQNPTARPAA
ncbi:MAG: hypothetical protein V7633_4 [Pseudonocardia sp.]